MANDCIPDYCVRRKAAAWPLLEAESIVQLINPATEPFKYSVCGIVLAVLRPGEKQEMRWHCKAERCTPWTSLDHVFTLSVSTLLFYLPVSKARL